MRQSCEYHSFLAVPVSWGTTKTYQTWISEVVRMMINCDQPVDVGVLCFWTNWIFARCLECLEYPLVNVHVTMEHHHF